MIYTNLTKKALKLSFDVHKEQVDKSGLPYVFHPFHLAEQMETEDTTIVALLHDVVEDSDLTLDDLRQERFVQLGSEASAEGYQYISNLISRGGISPEVLYVDKNDDVLLWVEMGHAVAITSNRTIEKHNPRVVVRELNMPEVKGHDITMAWRKSNYNPAIALFMELVEGYRA